MSTSGDAQSRAVAIMPRPNVKARPNSWDALNLTSEEAINFDYFKTNTLRFIPGMTRQFSAEQMFISMSQVEPAVLSAAIAVGSIHRSFESYRLRSTAADNLELQQSVGQQQYVKALRLLRDRLTLGKEASRGDVALISCYLFICLELLQGDLPSALSHFRAGMGILSEHTRGNDLPQEHTTTIMRSTPSPESIVEMFKAPFARLDIQATMFGEPYPRLFLLPSSNVTSELLWIPPMFKSVIESREYLDAISSTTFGFRAHIVHDVAFPGGSEMHPYPKVLYRWAHLNPKLPDFAEIDARLPERQNEIEEKLTDWKKAFNKFVTKNAQSLPPEDRRDTRILHLFYYALVVMLKESLSTRQMFLDQYLEEFY